MALIRSIDLIEKYLAENGYGVETVVLDTPRPSLSVITAPSGKSMTFYRDGLIYPFAMSTLVSLFRNKIKSYAFAATKGLEIPKTVVVDADMVQRDDVGQSLLQSVPSVIVKPYNGRRSNGLTINITTEEQLKQAIAKALTLSEKVLVQEQFFGEEARFIVIQGKVRAVLLRQKPVVIGDGQKTIAQLIAADNEQRASITTSLVQYPQLDASNVPRELLQSNAIPAEGERVELSQAGMIRYGASVYNILDQVHSSYIALVEKVVAKTGVGMSVVDIMSRDFSAPAEKDSYVFIEFNSNPSLAMCYSCRDGKNFMILEEYLGDMLKDIIERQGI